MKFTELAVVVPIYNECVNIEKVITEWRQEFQRLGVAYEFLAINDGSTDGTKKILQHLVEQFPGTVVVIEKENAGHGSACRTGYSLAVARGAAWTFQIDSDGQCDPKFFSEFWNGHDDFDCVFGNRKTRDDGAVRVLISAACRFVTFLASGKDLKDLNVPYRLMRTSALKAALLKIPEDFDMQNVALTLTLKRNPSLRWKYVPIHFRDRQGDAPGINLRRILSMGWGLLGNLHKIER